MANPLPGAWPILEPIITRYQLATWGETSVKYKNNYSNFHSIFCVRKRLPQNLRPFSFGGGFVCTCNEYQRGYPACKTLTHCGHVAHICVSKPTIIGSDNGLSSGRRQAIIWTNTGILLIGPLGTNFSEILIEIYTFSFNKMHLKMSSGKWRPFCLGLNVSTATCSWVTKWDTNGAQCKDRQMAKFIDFDEFG